MYDKELIPLMNKELFHISKFNMRMWLMDSRNNKQFLKANEH